MKPEEVLFTRQRHEADKAGLHYDIRLVQGGKAYSWATKKDVPALGESIALWEQPVHTSEYALSEKVEIPKGSYGAGTTTLDFVRKARLKKGDGHWTLHTSDGKERYLLKPMPSFGEGAWLFKNLGVKKEVTQDNENKYLDKVAQFLRSEGNLVARAQQLDLAARNPENAAKITSKAKLNKFNNAGNSILSHVEGYGSKAPALLKRIAYR